MQFARSLCLVGMISAFIEAKPLQLDIAAESAILMNADTGAILYEKNAQEKYHPASITKIATAAYVLNATQTSLDEKIAAQQDAIGSVSVEAKRRSNYTLPSHWLTPDASHIGIKRGEILTMRDLLYGMMLASGDDASNVIAQHVGGTVPDFMDQVNTYLVSIGCKNTHFNNPHGLFHPKHLTTALDMALLTRHAMQNPTFCEIVSTSRYTRPKTNKQESTTLLQTNRLIREGKLHYPKAVGVKTGYIAAAQNTFVAAARSDNRLLIAVLLKVKERSEMFTEAIKLFEAAFAEEKVSEEILAAGPQRITLSLENAKRPLKTYTTESIQLEYYPAEEPAYKTIVVWDKVSLPVAKGQRLGELRLQTPQGDILRQVTLYSEDNAKMSWSAWFRSFFS